MPDLSDRITRESELDTELQRAFSRQHKRVIGTPLTAQIDWREFQSSIGDAFATNLGVTFGVASANMLRTQATDREEELALLLFLLADDGLVRDVQRRLTNLTPNRLPDSARQWADGTSRILASETVARTQAQILKARRVAAEAAQTAETAAEAIQRERDAYFERIDPLFRPTRSESIAITETTRAISQGEGNGRLIIETNTGRVLESIWMTEVEKFGTDPPIGPPPPYGVCPICLPFHKKREPAWHNEFPTGPPAHPRCRCFLDWRVLSGVPFGVN